MWKWSDQKKIERAVIFFCRTFRSCCLKCEKKILRHSPFFMTLRLFEDYSKLFMDYSWILWIIHEFSRFFQDYSGLFSWYNNCMSGIEIHSCLFKIFLDYSRLLHCKSKSMAQICQWLFMSIHDYLWLFKIIHDYSRLSPSLEISSSSP